MRNEFDLLTDLMTELGEISEMIAIEETTDETETEAIEEITAVLDPGREIVTEVC